MEATIQIDGKDVRFKATAAVPMLYRMKFRRDLLTDMQQVAKALEKARQETGETTGDGQDVTMSCLPLPTLTMFEQLAYIMAKHADPSMEADSPEEWMDQFSMMSIYAVFPVIQALWENNMERLEEAKKKAERLIEILQRRSSSSEPYNSGSPSVTSNS